MGFYIHTLNLMKILFTIFLSIFIAILLLPIFIICHISTNTRWDKIKKVYMQWF